MEKKIFEKYEKLEGTVLDERYLLEKLIGVGGMAVVFRAIDKLVYNNVVAIKMLKEDIACDRTMLKRFANESRVEDLIRHPNIVAMYQFCATGEYKYMVMEYVSGITLKRYLKAKGKPLSFDELMSYTIQTLKALKVAHDNGIIHRDIKPQNIMLLRNGHIKVMDFGIAKLPNAETVTMTDKAIGTVYYMSPEQASAKPIDCRSDLYSLGAMLYELATGRLPFDGESPVSIAVKQINEEPIPPREINPDVPVGLEQIILCAMSKKPSERFQSADIMLDYVKRLQKNKKIKFEKLKSRSGFSNFVSTIRRVFGVNKK
ncbi:MAG: serine/threonine protein kinase [Clostridia bacterium]|nr:serine/threonine protein kinase [Clostridia bacterium]